MVKRIEAHRVSWNPDAGSSETLNTTGIEFEGPTDIVILGK